MCVVLWSKICSSTTVHKKCFSNATNAFHNYYHAYCYFFISTTYHCTLLITTTILILLSATAILELNFITTIQ